MAVQPNVNVNTLIANAQPASYTFFDLDPNYQNSYQYVHKTTVAPGTVPGSSVVTQTTTEGVKKPSLFARMSHTLKGIVSGDSFGWGSDTNQRWGLFGLQEELLAEFPCKVLNADKFVRGYMFVSPQHLCFASFSTASNQILKFMFPMSSIQCINQAQRVKARNTVPTFVPLTTSGARPDSIQIVTNDNVLHSFYGFSDNLLNAVNILTHTWNNSRGVSGQTGLMQQGYTSQPSMMQQQPGLMQQQPGLMQQQPGLMQQQGYQTSNLSGQPGYVQGQPGYVQQGGMPYSTSGLTSTPTSASTMNVPASQIPIQSFGGVGTTQQPGLVKEMEQNLLNQPSTTTTTQQTSYSSGYPTK